jgi:hypothetical protein
MMHTTEEFNSNGNNSETANQAQQPTPSGAPPAGPAAATPAEGEQFGAERIFYLNKPKDIRDGLAAGVGNFLKGNFRPSYFCFRIFILTSYLQVVLVLLL